MNDNFTIALAAFLCLMAVITAIFAASMSKRRRPQPMPLQPAEQIPPALSLRRTMEAASEAPVVEAEEPSGEEFDWGAEETPSTES